MKYFVLLLFTGFVQASNIEVYQFDHSNQEKIYKALTEELRCLVCQNQNIADSNAELAQDMRRKTYDLVKQGLSKREIADFMAARYGDFVLYKPPFKTHTAILWLAPFLLLGLGIGFLLRNIHLQNKKNTPTHPLSQQQLQTAAKLLSTNERKTP